MKRELKKKTNYFLGKAKEESNNSSLIKRNKNFKLILISCVFTAILASFLVTLVWAQDTTPPTGSIIINNGDITTTSTTVTLTLTY